MVGDELSPNSRFQISDLPVSLPGKCALCGSSSGEDRKYVDFGMQLDVYGAVYFCTFCVTELAEAIGFIERKPFEMSIAANTLLANEKKELRKEFEEYRNATRILLRNCHCDEPGAVADVSESSEDADDSIGEPGGANYNADESSGSEGFDVLPEFAGNDEPIAPKRRTRKSS